MTADRTVLLAALFGLLGVAAGAFGAHGLESRVSAEQLEWWGTGARYQQIHAVALLVVGWSAGEWTRWKQRAGWCFTLGMIVFAGTLYAMTLGGPRILGAVTPLGGLLLMLGWAAVAAHAITQRRGS
jgi:uncharacterized membrane protein YgdD (TMEM256/DUF423 family)